MSGKAGLPHSYRGRTIKNGARGAVDFGPKPVQKVWLYCTERMSAVVSKLPRIT